MTLPGLVNLNSTARLIERNQKRLRARLWVLGQARQPNRCAHALRRVRPGRGSGAGPWALIGA